MAERLRDLTPRDIKVRRVVGANIRQKREAVGQTVLWLATKAGVSDATVVRMEQGKQAISVEVLARFARNLDTTVAVLCREVG